MKDIKKAPEDKDESKEEGSLRYAKEYFNESHRRYDTAYSISHVSDTKGV